MSIAWQREANLPSYFDSPLTCDSGGVGLGLCLLCAGKSEA
jgi:hypothetical protein